jgi:hypothetical protein
MGKKREEGGGRWVRGGRRRQALGERMEEASRSGCLRERRGGVDLDKREQPTRSAWRDAGG